MTCCSGQVTQGLRGEGLGVDTASGDVWHSDVIAVGVHRLAPDGSTASFNRERMWAGGVMVNEDGTGMPLAEVPGRPAPKARFRLI